MNHQGPSSKTGVDQVDELYRHALTTITGEPLALSTLKERALLIVNTASKCGLTPQYKALEEIHRSYKDRGLTLIGCPCNQFGHQEPGTEAEVQSFCNLNYDVSFTLTQKLNVNGADAHPLFVDLKRLAPGVLGISMVKWNFTKFLVLPARGDTRGRVIRYAPKTSPHKIKSDLDRYLS